MDERKFDAIPSNPTAIDLVSERPTRICGSVGQVVNNMTKQDVEV
jgi:hypothetical protein